jgi:hypothetical protein
MKTRGGIRLLRREPTPIVDHKRRSRACSEIGSERRPSQRRRFVARNRDGYSSHLETQTI